MRTYRRDKQCDKVNHDIDITPQYIAAPYL